MLIKKYIRVGVILRIQRKWSCVVAIFKWFIEWILIFVKQNVVTPSSPTTNLVPIKTSILKLIFFYFTNVKLPLNGKPRNFGHNMLIRRVWVISWGGPLLNYEGLSSTPCISSEYRIVFSFGIHWYKALNVVVVLYRLNNVPVSSLQLLIVNNIKDYAYK